MPPRVAIACQGGGSHAAFTAGVLAALHAPAHRDRFELMALSGTSGGAVCAALAWSGLLEGGPAEAVRRLEGFWADLAPANAAESWANDWFQLLLALPFAARTSPYAYAPAAEPRLRQLLENWVCPAALPARRAPPHLRLGAAEVLRGGGAAFDEEGFTLDDVIASAAVPPLFRAVPNRGGLWWDGLYAHNPPIRHLLDLPDKPAEIWVVRINPATRAEEPRTAEEIEDRRNEMAGNLPLDHELEKVRLVNRAVAAAPECNARFGWRPVTVRQVALALPGLGYRTKLDRSAAHIARLMAAGRDAAPGFFEDASVIVRPEG
ncbi:MAG TPA: patatin-like phospholipase family protein [Falsiroseomonas sp.]|jgi:NTE family protein|nr:patatin-like phospholipase family protein [Falsiroseomonas sp.]